MNNILILGNSSSGKTTLAKDLSKAHDFTHLDLDSLAWEPSTPPERKPLSESALEITKFIDSNSNWIIEGCYIDLLELAAPYSNEVIFMNLSVEACISNAKSRSWEPHKYSSKEAQDANLEMLINWIIQYTERQDTFSETTHKRFYNEYLGKKSMVTCNERNILRKIDIQD